MGWWSVQRYDNNNKRSPKVELANTTSSVNRSKKSGVVVQARAASPSNLGAFALGLNGHARRSSKPARWRCGVYFTKEWMHHEIPGEPARRGSQLSDSSCFDGPTETIDESLPGRKALV
jgi:hypothetical protein